MEHGMERLAPLSIDPDADAVAGPALCHQYQRARQSGLGWVVGMM
eukprot:SAG25_NODE_731_length_5686_cov_14.271523_3_plen_45_part_00